MSAPGICLADIKEIRRRARQHLGGGALMQNYGGKVEDAIALLNHALATAIVCVLRYTGDAADGPEPGHAAAKRRGPPVSHRIVRHGVYAVIQPIV